MLNSEIVLHLIFSPILVPEYIQFVYCLFLCLKSKEI